MAARPQMTVRLSQSIEHALDYIAEREKITPAELARNYITASALAHLQRHGWERDCQSDYMAWLERQAAADRAAGGALVGVLADIDVAGTADQATVKHVESDGPYGPSATVEPLFPRAGLNPKPLSAIIGEADRLVSTLRPDGRKRRS